MAGRGVGGQARKMTNEQYVELVMVFWRLVKWWGIYETSPFAPTLSVTAVASPIKHASTTITPPPL